MSLSSVKLPFFFLQTSWIIECRVKRQNVGRPYGHNVVTETKRSLEKKQYQNNADVYTARKRKQRSLCTVPRRKKRQGKHKVKRNVYVVQHVNASADRCYKRAQKMKKNLGVRREYRVSGLPWYCLQQRIGGVVSAACVAVCSSCLQSTQIRVKEASQSLSRFSRHRNTV